MGIELAKNITAEDLNYICINCQTGRTTQRLMNGIGVAIAVKMFTSFPKDKFP